MPLKLHVSISPLIALLMDLQGMFSGIYLLKMYSKLFSFLSDGWKIDAH